MTANRMLAAVLTALSLLHVYWAGGGTWGAEASVPKTPEGQPLFRPGPLACLAVAAALAAGSALAVAGAFRWRSALLSMMAAVFALRALGDFRYAGWSKSVHGSDFATLDTWLYSPLCLALSALSWAAARRASGTRTSVKVEQT